MEAEDKMRAAKLARLQDDIHEGLNRCRAAPINENRIRCVFSTFSFLSASGRTLNCEKRGTNMGPGSRRFKSSSRIEPSFKHQRNAVMLSLYEAQLSALAILRQPRKRSMVQISESRPGPLHRPAVCQIDSA